MYVSDIHKEGRGQKKGKGKTKNGKFFEGVRKSGQARDSDVGKKKKKGRDT